jgi:hypothetical protein
VSAKKTPENRKFSGDRVNGAGERDRTADHLFTKQVLYQLSYPGKNSGRILAFLVWRQDLPDLTERRSAHEIVPISKSFSLDPDRLG